VSEEIRVRYVVTNHQNQPVELHLATAVVVLEPRGEAEVQESDLATPQLQVLQRQRLITIHQVVENPEPQVVESPEPRKRPGTAANPRRRR
jgi:hypothetical protein